MKDHIQLLTLIQWIKNQYATGSRIIGGGRPNSDYDFVATHADFCSFCDMAGFQREVNIKAEDIEEYAGDSKFLSFKYRLEQEHPWVNLIVVPDQVSLTCWINATVTLKECPPDIRFNSARRKMVFGWILNAGYRYAGQSERATWPDPQSPEVNLSKHMELIYPESFND